MDENIIINDDTEELLMSDAAQIIDEIEIKDVTSVEEGTIDTIRILPPDNINITLNEAFSPLGEPVENSHESLNGRYSPNQHSIEAIEGLEERLQDIESVKQVRSTGENVAHYYMWDDGNPSNDLRCGYFVSFVQGTNKIAISDTDVIGVTVNKENAGFIGRDINGTINPVIDSDDPDVADVQTYPYGLVCTNGRVRVRAMSGVSAGDKVIPAAGGIAQKSDNNYGYNVIATENDSGVLYAVICLVPPTMGLYELSDDISDMEDRLDIDEANIAAAINTANTALQNAGTTASQVSGQIVTIQGQVQSAIDTANAASVAATNAGTSAALAREIAASAQTTAESIQSQVTTNISTMEDDIQDLIDSVEPIVTWDGTNGTVGASYLIDHIQNDLATKTEVSTVDTKADNAFTAIQTNAKMLQTMAMVERKYTVGPHSPIYGMSYEYATEMIPVGMVYVPTVNVTDTTDDGNHSFTFYSGGSYEWDGTGWILHSDDSVIGYNSSSTFPIGTNQIKYWYVGASDVTHDDIIYPAGSLCLWSNGMWVVVANIKDYGNFHITSRLYQTADELGAEIANAQGDIASLTGRISNGEAALTALTAVDGRIALVEQKANENEAMITNTVLTNGATLIKTLDTTSDSMGNQFYTAEPTWDSINNRWSFSNTYYSVPQSPECYAQFTDDDTKYYKYTAKPNNVWERKTYKYNTNLASIKQEADDNSASISSIVSNIGANGAVTAASIIQKVNVDSSEISMSADRIKLTGGEISLATGRFKITANNGFELNENGISWNSASNPTKMVYSQELVAKPSNNTQYSSFPSSSTTTWHTSITANDKYASETTDGGATWSAVRQIVGIDGYTPQKGVDYFDGTNGSDGYTPVKGVDYFDGTNGTNGISYYTHIRYSANSDGTSFVDAPTSSTIYIGIYNGTSSTAPTSKTSYTWSKYHGDNGTAGNGISSITYYYASTTVQTAPNAVNITSTTMPTLDATNKYLWQKQVIDFTDASVSDQTIVSLIAVYGNTGDSVQVVRAYYLKNSATAPSKPTSSTLPNGWTSSPSGVTTSNQYEFVSECTVTNGSYGTWSNPVCYAHYGSDATVNDVNVFNVLTSNGTKFGLFNSSEDKLYINASYINTGTISADRIASNSITAAKINTTGLTAEKIQIKSGNNILFDAGYTSSSGVSIGGFTVTSSSLYSNNKSSYDSNTNGVYIGTNGIGLGAGKFYVTNSGDVTLSGNINMTGNINWGSNKLIKYQYSADNSSWHDTQKSSDKYRRESFDNGSTWGTGYQFIGTNGSTPSLPAYIQSTCIDLTQVASPYIKANEVDIYAKFNSNSSGGLVLYDVDSAIENNPVFSIRTSTVGNSSIQYITIGGDEADTFQRIQGLNLHIGHYDYDSFGTKTKTTFDGIIILNNSLYNTSSPGSSTPGYGIPGAIYFKIEE